MKTSDERQRGRGQTISSINYENLKAIVENDPKTSDSILKLALIGTISNDLSDWDEGSLTKYWIRNRKRTKNKPVWIIFIGMKLIHVCIRLLLVMKIDTV